MLTAVASGAARAVSIFTALISVPLTINYLGTERYGLWMTISSVIAILGFADLGMGNGVLNAINEANGKDDRELAKEYVSSGFFMLAGIAVALAASFAVAYQWVPWQKVFNISSNQAVSEAGPAMVVFIACFLINVPLGIVQRIQLGYQEGFENSLWQGLGSLLGLAGVLLAIYLKAGLPWLVLAMAGAPVLTSLLNGTFLFGVRRPWLRPRWRCATSQAAKKVFRLGILFFLLQLAVALAYSSDNLVTIQILGPEAVTDYSVAMRMFSIAPMILTMVLVPLWPAYGESITRGDIPWVRRTLIGSIGLSALVTSLPSALLIVFGAQLVSLWVGPEVAPPPLLLLGIGIWTVLQATGTALSMFLNGANAIGIQVILALLMSVAALGAKIRLTQSIGLPGIIWGTVIAYLLFEVIPYLFIVPKLFSNMKQNRQNG